MASVFTGLSSLRKKEERPREETEASKALNQYLAQKYGAGSNGAAEKPRKKKKKKAAPSASAVRVVDLDVTGYHDLTGEGAAPGPMRPTYDSDEPAEEAIDEEEGPVIANPEEAARLQRIAEQERNFYEQAGDGSGWQAINAAAGGAAADSSPPRRRPARHDSPDASPPRRRAARHDSPDASPPRRAAARRDSLDASPPRRTGLESRGDPSLPMLPGRESSRLQQRPRQPGASGPHQEEPGAHKMSDGTRAGMVSGRDVAHEMALKREAEARRFAAMGEDASGRGAQTVYRDATGTRVTREEFVEGQQKARRKAEYEEEGSLAWGGGLKQRQEAEERAQAMREEASKPFARSRDDAELDGAARAALRWGDPMAHLVKRGAADLEALAPALDAALQGSGFLVPQEVPPHSWLRRGLGPPPNRYGIRPGRHWDGVDRSNGFEVDMFKRRNELKRRGQEAFQWAQEDM
uniref:BUD13-like protein n=1 Tax=Auxenochlorella protothecoides TaxID=3075 RepID=A0A1D2AD31_AUXPR